MKEFIIADSSGTDLCMMPETCSVDMEIGTDTENDFALTVPYTVYDASLMMSGGYLYQQGTEYGGQLADPEESTSDNTITFTGDTWRGLLEQKVVCPPSGSAYKVLSGTLHSCMQTLLGSQFGDLFAVTGSDTVTVTNWQVDRYVTLLDAFVKLLDAYGYKLVISADGENYDSLKILLDAQPIVDYSDDIEISQDTEVNFEITKVSRAYNYMVCGGSGDLAARVIVILHRKDDGTIEQVSSIPDGVGVRVYFYDYANAESTDELIESGKEQFDEINDTDSQEVTFDSDDDDYLIGDIVGGRSYVTGFTVSEQITQKVISVENNTISISYKVGT